MIKHLFNKLESLEKEIADERGDFSLFGLFLREDAEDRWDLLVAAPWLDADSIGEINYITNKLKSHVEENELLSISRIILLDLNDPIVQLINKVRVMRGGSLELNNPQLYGLPFKNAYIIISKGKKPVSMNVGKRKLRQTI